MSAPSSTAASRLEVQVGIATDPGGRPDNQDYAGCFLGSAQDRARFGVVAALADGVGGARGGRIAAELAVRGFIDAMLGQSELLAPRRTIATAVQAINSWVNAKGKTDPDLAGMACTFTAAVLRGRQIHVAHLGDSRLYRLREGRLERLTSDHVYDQPGMRNVLRRAVGPTEGAHIDYWQDVCLVYDRFLLCSDGVHGPLSTDAIRRELGRQAASEDTAGALVAAALAAGGTDNATALVLDVLDLPSLRQSDLEVALSAQPIRAVPDEGATVDGFRLDRQLSDGRYSRVFAAADTVEGRLVVIKFPKPVHGTDQLLRQAFLREGWIAARVRSPWVGGAVTVPADRQTRLYSVQPFHEGETLEGRLSRAPRVTAAEGVRIAIQLARAVGALHRAGIVHRDIKPDNVILARTPGRPDEPPTVKLIDLGVARIPHAEDFAAEHAPGTASFMAPELFGGEAGNESSDQFALGVTLFRLFTGAYPFGEIEPFTRPRFGRPRALATFRADLPAWLDDAITRAVAADPDERFGDVLEFAFALEHGSLVATPVRTGRRSLYDRDPLRFWKGLSATLALALIVTLAVMAGRAPHRDEHRVQVPPAPLRGQ